MEIEGEDGSKISIGTEKVIEFGRNLGFPLNEDQTVSRRHILFQLHNQNSTPNSETRVAFQVLGKNPIWFFNSKDGDTRVYKKFDKGEMRVGDSFCVSAKKPLLFKLKKGEEVEEEEQEKEKEKEKGGLDKVEGREKASTDDDMAESVQSEEKDEELGFGSSVDVSHIHPVQEFGFLVIGHEFDHYPRTKIRAIKDLNWFLEEPRVDSEMDDAIERKCSKGRVGMRRKKKDGGYDDEEWTGESEDEKEVISKVRNGKRPRYTTRSKDFNKPLGVVGTSKKFEEKKVVSRKEEEENADEEEEEDTLAGFIVNEELEEEYNDDEEEEEEEEEDYEDEDEDDEDD